MKQVNSIEMDMCRNKLTLREYQKQAIDNLMDFVKNQLRDVLHESGGDFQNATLLEMATGSGKTFTVGRYLNKIIQLRNRYNSRYDENEFLGFNVIFLTNRIDGLEQFRDDLIHGKKGDNSQGAILDTEILENIESYTFHSQADNLDIFDGIIREIEDEREVFNPEKKTTKDHLYFSTYQTASLKDIATKLDYIDVIVIDEAHNVKENNEFQGLLEKLYMKGRQGKSPQILPVTATPSNLTKELFGESIFKFGLSEYLASDYSPDVEYNLITATDANPKDIVALKLMIEDAQKIADIKEKKLFISDIETRINNIMSSYPSNKHLVEDILYRILEKGELAETIIFTNNIKEANNISKEINKVMKKDISLSYHSVSQENNAICRLENKDDEIKIVVAVDMLNESIDLPTVSDVVFLRKVDQAKIFFQQFGRGLRGKGVVKYWDYVGSMKNFSWIGNIHENYLRISDEDDFEGSGRKGVKKGNKKFSLIGHNSNSQEYEIDLSRLGFQVLKLQNERPMTSREYYSNITFEEFQEDLKNMNKCTKDTKEQVRGIIFHRIFDGYPKYKLGIMDAKKRKGYHGIITGLFRSVKKYDIRSFEDFNQKFWEKKEKIDMVKEARIKSDLLSNDGEFSGQELREEKKIKMSSKIYYKELIFEDFQKDLGEITDFKTLSKSTINGLSFKQVYDGCMNYKLGIKKKNERVQYRGYMVQLLQKVKQNEIGSFEELDQIFLKGKEKIDFIKETQLTPKCYYKNLIFKDFQKDLGEINIFTVNSKEKIKGMSFLQIYTGYLNYKCNIKTPKERKGYYGVVLKLLKKVKTNEIQSFEKLKEEFWKEKEIKDRLK
ncbi:MAG: DEAD/DEAH box helicase family protein [Candidatus Gracilibacteria bacterium]|nr:DEAD/DEAH box helicase family protein [Candidatus Gracilibacteria bacterium]